ncbi:MAG: hypothetical protein DRQ13_11595 [Ignavibacteriae bacterium]|nr:MAG: hypothetical protein DRQ13_11595 [Ignavibacteriota bacterium]
MKKIFFSLVILIIFNGISCSVYETFVNLSRLQFKLGDVNNFNVNGINISNKSKLEDFSPFEILNLSTVVASGKLPISFTLNVDAKNPNDGTGGYAKTDATLKSFPWRLQIDNKETISGNIASPVSVPGTGEVSIIPIQINIDLMQFIESQGYESLLNLVLALGGQQGSAARLTLFADPTVSTALGDINYPGELKIVDHQFSN